MIILLTPILRKRATYAIDEADQTSKKLGKHQTFLSPVCQKGISISGESIWKKFLTPVMLNKHIIFVLDITLKKR